MEKLKNIGDEKDIGVRPLYKTLGVKPSKDEKDMKKLLFDLVAFRVPEHRSILYRCFRTKERLHEDLDEAISLGANVISIRLVESET
jgi:hypothetical protein